MAPGPMIKRAKPPQLIQITRHVAYKLEQHPVSLPDKSKSSRVFCRHIHRRPSSMHPFTYLSAAALVAVASAYTDGMYFKPYNDDTPCNIILPDGRHVTCSTVSQCPRKPRPF